MISKILENCNRVFIIGYYLADNTMSVNELSERNSGFIGKMFLKRDKVQLPEQATYTSKPPLCYEPQHMFVGAQLIINGFHFILIDEIGRAHV